MQKRHHSPEHSTFANLLEHHATHVKYHEAEQREHESLVRMAGCYGVPRNFGSMRIERVDLSPDGDGSQLLARDMVEMLVETLCA